MKKEKIKVYTYTRVSTAMQIDGYSLDAQKSRMKAFAEFNDYEIAHEYEDAGKSGKSIEGRTQFNQMMEDIKTGKDGVSFVLVFKLSRFGRNAADVLSTLQVMQDFGVNLICVEDGIDSSKDAGKLMISVLSAVAEIERENIRVQTMEGRIQKAREGKWNGGFAPYGYKLVDGKLEINEEEAPAIRTIYEQYVTTDSGANGIAKYLENHGISKVQRQNGKNPLFDARLIRMILKNPVYCGKIAYGRRKTEKVHGTRNEYRLVEQENFLLVDGLHEAIIPEDVWQAAQVKLAAQAKRYEHVNKGKNECTHLLSGIVKCPICGVGMYGNKCVKRKADGSKYKDFYYYGCKHRSMTRGHKCDYKKQIRKELLDDAVAEVICKLVSNPKFAAMMQEKINMKVDTTAIEQEISNYEKQLRQAYSTKSKLIEEIDSLDPDDRHYSRRKSDLDDRLYGMYDKIEELESLLIAARAKKQAIEAEKLTGDNIYKVLIYFDQLYGKMNDREKRQLIEELISEIQIYPERQPNGQWLKSIKFRLPIIEEDMNISLDNEQQVDAMTGDKLLNFVNNILFPVLKGNDVKDGDAVLYEGIKVTPDTPIKKAIVKSAFEDANNYMKDGVYLRQVIDVIDEIAFDDVKESHAFGFVYEEILRELQSAGSSGEFYTPRAVTEFMALMIKPQLGEKMADFACGTGGFITSWLGQLSGQVTDTTAQKQLDDSIYGVEKKPFPYLLCVTNMLLHDIEVPNIYHMNSLKHNLLDYTDEDKFDVILMNPPYGGHEDKSIQGFFPDDLASAETADLFMSVIMYRLKKKGRAAVVVPDGFLFGLDNAKVNIKKKLISQFNLHTVVRLPGSVFSPYTSITTNLLFFDNTKPTTETWFYRVDIPSDRKHFSKTKPMELKHFDDCIAWWNDRKEIPDGENFKAQKFTAEYLLNEQGCNIDLCGYPHEEEEILDPLDTIREYQERRTTLNAEIDKVLAELEALLPGGVIE